MKLQYENIYIPAEIICPKCGEKILELSPDKEHATDAGCEFLCVDCGVVVTVCLIGLDTRSPTLRAPVQSEQNEAFKNDDIIELLYKLAGRVETAGIYGNVRVDDVEFAQYCLNRVEPLIRLRSNRSDGG